MVECSTTLNCSSDSELMTARECCVNSVDGHAYTIPGSGDCHTCIGTSPMKISTIFLSEAKTHFMVYSFWLAPRYL